MGDFSKELAGHTKEIHEIGNSTLKGADLAKKYKEDLKKINPEQIAKKIEESAKGMPDRVKVQNLTKERAQVQSVDKDEIE